MGTNRQGRQIKVSAEIIAEATKADSSHCMIADAVRAQVPGASYVSVDLQTIRFTDREKGVRYIYLTPMAAQQQLVRFDQGHEMKPFSFQLRTRDASITPIRTASKVANAKAKIKRTTAPGKAKAERYRRVGGIAPPSAVLATTRGRVRRYGVKSLPPVDETPTIERLTQQVADLTKLIELLGSEKA